MLFLEKINSMETLEEHLREHPQIPYEVFALVRHLVKLGDQLEDIPSRRFLLSEAECWQTQNLNASARLFVAKRIFAFWRKDLFPVLAKNLSFFPEETSRVSPEVALDILKFVPLENVIADCATVEMAVDSSQQESSPEDVLELQLQEKHAEIENAWIKLQKMEMPLLPLKEYRKALKEKLNANYPIHRFPQLLQEVISTYRDTQEKFPLMQLKNQLKHCENNISDAMTILVLINYGYPAVEHLLQKFTQFTRVAAVNQNLHRYLYAILDRELTEHGKAFRQMVEKCQIRDDLLLLMAQYPLYDKTTIRKWPSLRIIDKIKLIVDTPCDNERDLNKLLARHLGSGEANMKHHLPQVLLYNSIYSEIQQTLRNVNNINQLFKQLQQLKKNPETRNLAKTLLQLIGTFLRGRHKVSFHAFKAGLNLASPPVQQRILRAVKRKLRKDLQSQVQKVLTTKGSPEKRWRKLLSILRNPQYQSPDLQLFGYSLEEWLQNLQRIAESDSDVEIMVNHIVGDRVPQSLRDLIIEQHHFIFKSRKKNSRNCYRDLLKICKNRAKGEIFSLQRPLVDLFQYYGKVDFAMPESENLTGYEISRIISKFYHNPTRTTIEFPENLPAQFTEILTAAINKERVKQLDKIHMEHGEPQGNSDTKFRESNSS